MLCKVVFQLGVRVVTGARFAALTYHVTKFFSDVTLLMVPAIGLGSLKVVGLRRMQHEDPYLNEIIAGFNNGVDTVRYVLNNRLLFPVKSVTYYTIKNRESLG